MTYYWSKQNQLTDLREDPKRAANYFQEFQKITDMLDIIGQNTAQYETMDLTSYYK